MPSPTIVIIGASLAGAKAAEGARRAGHEGPIVLVGDEDTLPYERPPLSKKFLRGEADAASAQVFDANFYEAEQIELVHAHATALDVAAKRVSLDNGDDLAYDTVVLTTGAEPVVPQLPGADLDGVHYLRTIDDSARLGEAIRSASRVAVIGAGWIGCEVAASARQLNARVVMIEPMAVPLQRVLGEHIGGVFRDLHAAHGVAVRLGVGVSELHGTKAVEEVGLEDGQTEEADVVVVGVGVRPRVALAEAAGLAVDNGVVVNEYLEASSPDVFAAGDVASAWSRHYGRNIRTEHWANALNQGFAAGRNAAGQHEAYDRLPYFFSDQYDLGLEYIGWGEATDSLVVRGDTESREFIAFWHRDGVLTAAMAVNVWDVVDEFRRLISAGVALDPARLADPDVSLGEL